MEFAHVILPQLKLEYRLPRSEMMVCLTLLLLLGYSAWLVHGQATVCPRISGQPGCVCNHSDGVIDLTILANTEIPRYAVKKIETNNSI